MTYATINDFVTTFTPREAVALSNSDDAAATSVNSVALGQALDEASVEIDGYMARRYALPFSSLPKVLKNHCLNIARYRLSSVSPGEDVRKRFEDTIQYLKDVGNGDLDLGIDADNQQIPGTGTPAFVRGPAVWTEDKLRNF